MKSLNFSLTSISKLHVTMVAMVLGLLAIVLPQSASAAVTVSNVAINVAPASECAKVGTWNASTNTCTLTDNVILADNTGVPGFYIGNGQTLDCNNYSITAGNNAVEGVIINIQANDPVHINNCTIDGFETGIQIDSVGAVTAFEVNLDNNTINASDYGVHYVDTDNPTVGGRIVNNTITTSVNGSYPIYGEISTQNLLIGQPGEGNTFNNDAATAVTVVIGDTNTVHNTTIVGWNQFNSVGVIFEGEVNNAQIRSNTADYDRALGQPIFRFATDDILGAATVQSNIITCTTAVATGIRVSGGSSSNLRTTVSDNTVSGCGTGIDVSVPVGKVSVYRNTIDNNSQGAIVAGDVWVFDNEITNSINYGIAATSAEVKVYDNLFSNTTNVEIIEDPEFPEFNQPAPGVEWTSAISDVINVLGGPQTGGNYWGTPAGDGFSDTCVADETAPSFCANDYTVASFSNAPDQVDTAPLSKDADGDGVDNWNDAFPNDPSETVDSDGDGVGDNSDAFPNDPTESADTDGDGVGDNGDNCPNASNPTQADLDEDDIGDACDNATTLDLSSPNHLNGYSVILPLGFTPVAGNDEVVVDIEENNPNRAGINIEVTLLAGTYKTVQLPRPDENHGLFVCVKDYEGAEFIGAAGGDVAACRSNDSEGLQELTGVTGSANLLLDDGHSVSISWTADSVTVGNLRHTVIEFLADDDNDGVPNFDDAFPNDPTESVDSDGDGVGDNSDNCPFEYGEGADGCPVVVTDLTTTGYVELHTLDLVKPRVLCGTGKPSCREALAGVEFRMFEMPAGYARADVPTYWDSLTALGSAVSDANGNYELGHVAAASDMYLLVSNYNDGVFNAREIEYDGMDMATEDIQYIFQHRSSGDRWLGGAIDVTVGSLLETLYPEYMVWEGTTEYYPVTFISTDDWQINACASAPEGYELTAVYDEDSNVVSTSDCLHSLLAGEPQVFLFEMVDLASPAPEFALSLDLKHNGKHVKKQLKVKGHRNWAKAADKASQKASKKQASVGGTTLTLASNQTVWGAAAAQLGSGASNDEIKGLAKAIALANGIAVPEWGIKGWRNARSLSAGTSLDLSGLAARLAELNR